MIWKHYQVDTVPRHLAPFAQAYGVLGAAGFVAACWTAARTCNWHFESSSSTDDKPYSEPCIHCLWHEYIPTYMSYYFYHRRFHDTNLVRNKHIWLQHPSLYMLPVHRFLEWNQIDKVLGSSRHGGQDAMNTLIHRLQQKEGDSLSSSSRSGTSFFPDGPGGPIHKVKSGVVQVAQATQLPIVPIQFDIESSVRIGWDQKHFPLPFSKIGIRELEPVVVSKNDDISAKVQELQDLLNEDV